LSNPYLAKPDPSALRYALYCGAYKLDLTSAPERALGTFEIEAIAHKLGQLMWPSFYEVIDLQAKENS
jgi:hypothetical protein